jgi:putative aldouronate transport system permease protein
MAERAGIIGQDGRHGDSRFTLGVHRFKSQIHLQMMTLPGIAFLLIFSYIPMLGLVVAFQDYKITLGYLHSPFAGLKYFREMVGDPAFWPAFRNTVLLSLYGIVFGFPAPIILALILNEIPHLRFKRFVQTASYLPYFISYVVVAAMWIMLLSSRGLVNQMLLAFGIVKAPVDFLTNPGIWRGLATGVNIWKGVGWSAIIYLAAITSIDAELYEAAVIDGAGRLRRIVSITLPNMVGIISVLLILRMGSLVRASLDTSYLLGNYFTRSTSYVLEYYTLEMGLELGRYSFATAIGISQSILALILVLGANWASGRISGRRIF